MKYYRFWLDCKEHDDTEFTRKDQALKYFFKLIKSNKYRIIVLEREWDRNGVCYTQVVCQYEKGGRVSTCPII